MGIYMKFYAKCTMCKTEGEVSVGRTGDPIAAFERIGWTFSKNNDTQVCPDCTLKTRCLKMERERGQDLKCPFCKKKGTMKYVINGNEGYWKCSKCTFGLIKDWEVQQ